MIIFMAKKKENNIKFQVQVIIVEIKISIFHKKDYENKF